MTTLLLLVKTTESLLVKTAEPLHTDFRLYLPAQEFSEVLPALRDGRNGKLWRTPRLRSVCTSTASHYVHRVRAGSAYPLHEA